jgi:hypothetical protein
MSCGFFLVKKARKEFPLERSETEQENESWIDSDIDIDSEAPSIYSSEIDSSKEEEVGPDEIERNLNRLGELFKRLKDKLPLNPLDHIIMEFGKESVAEVNKTES